MLINIFHNIFDFCFLEIDQMVTFEKRTPVMIEGNSIILKWADCKKNKIKFSSVIIIIMRLLWFWQKNSQAFYVI